MHRHRGYPLLREFQLASGVKQLLIVLEPQLFSFTPEPTHPSIVNHAPLTISCNYHSLSAWSLSREFTTTGAVVLCLFSAVTTRQQRKQCSLYKGPFNASDQKPTRSVSKVSFPALLSVMTQFEIKLQIWWRECLQMTSLNCAISFM